MAKQVLLWTVLPFGKVPAGSPHEGMWRVSVVVSPRLTPESADEQNLASFAAWLDWPRTLERARFGLDLTSRIRDREQTLVEKIRQNSQMAIAQNAAWVDAAAQIYTTALEAKVSRVFLMSSNELSTMAQ